MGDRRGQLAVLEEEGQVAQHHVEVVVAPAARVSFVRGEGAEWIAEWEQSGLRSGMSMSQVARAAHGTCVQLTVSRAVWHAPRSVHPDAHAPRMHARAYGQCVHMHAPVGVLCEILLEDGTEGWLVLGH